MKRRRVTVSSRMCELAARMIEADADRRRAAQFRPQLVRVLCPFDGADTRIFVTPDQQLRFLAAQARQ